MKRKRLFVDIETSPLRVFVFSLNDPANAYISHDNIDEDRAVIVIGYKWEGEKKTSALTWNSRRCDKAMLKAFVRVLENADEVVAHNGDRFDIPWLRWRYIYHSIPFPPRLPSFDTLKELKAKTRPPSFRLDYLGHELCGERKLETEKGLWKKVVRKVPGSLEQMTAYCKQDVRLLEKLFVRVRPWLDAKTTVAANSRDCPECGSSHTRFHDRRISAAGQVKVQFKCMGCGSYHSVSGPKYDVNKPLEVA